MGDVLVSELVILASGKSPFAYRVNQLRIWGNLYSKSKPSVRFPGLLNGPCKSEDDTLKKLLTIAARVRARPTPPNSDVKTKLISRLRVRLKLIFTPWIRGRGGKRFPASWPKKKSVFIGPNQLNTHGNSKASLGAARNI